MIMAAISSKAAGSTKSATRKNAQVQTRGIRNNNPLNIRHSTNKWQGMAPSQSDRAFVQFTARKYGYRAAFVLIRNYIGLHHANTKAFCRLLLRRFRYSVAVRTGRILFSPFS